MQQYVIRFVALLPSRLKLSLILQQAVETQIDILDEAYMIAGYGRWEATFGLRSRPSPDADVTLDQLTAVDYLYRSGVIPYCDFAIWGPYGRASLQQRVFATHALSGGGEWTIKGIPPRVAQLILWDNLGDSAADQWHEDSGPCSCKIKTTVVPNTST